MTTLSLREAAEAAGVSKSTIFRAIQSGRMSGPRDDDGNFVIDPAELFRVYPPKSIAPTENIDARDVPGQAETRPEGQGAPDHDTVELRVRNASLEAEIKGLRELAEELRKGRDQWQAQAERATLMLAKPEGTTAVERVPPRGTWWPWKRSA